MNEKLKETFNDKYTVEDFVTEGVKFVPDSSNLAFIVWNKERNMLLASFSTRSTYLYDDVSEDDFKALVDAPSAGSYFSKNIAKGRPFLKLATFVQKPEKAAA